MVCPQMENSTRNGQLMRRHSRAPKLIVELDRAIQDMFSRIPSGFQEMHQNYNLSSRDAYICKCIARGVAELDALAGSGLGRVYPGDSSLSCSF